MEDTAILKCLATRKFRYLSERAVAGEILATRRDSRGSEGFGCEDEVKVLNGHCLI